MSQILIRRSTPSRNTPDEFNAADAFEAGMTPYFITESRSVVKQFSANDGTLDCMFTIEINKDQDRIILKAFDPDRAVITALTYDSAVALYAALSDHLDTLEANLDNVYATD